VLLLDTLSLTRKKNPHCKPKKRIFAPDNLFANKLLTRRKSFIFTRDSGESMSRNFHRQGKKNQKGDFF